MHAASIQWRPLGQMLVERGLLTPEELEDVLLAQQETGRPLGQIIVDRGLISAPTLAVTLAEQCGVELETEVGFGSGLWSAIQSRHKAENRRRSDLRMVPALPDGGSDTPGPVEHDPPPKGEELRAKLGGQTPGHGGDDPRVIELERALQERTDRVAALEESEGTTRRELQRLLDQLAERDARLRELSEHRVEVEATEARLAEADARIGQLEEALEARQHRVDALEAEKQARAQELEQASAPRASERSLKREQKDLASRERSLRKEAASVERRAREASERAEELERERKEIEGRAEDVRERELTLEARAAELADRERALDARTQEIEAGSAELAERARGLAEHEEKLSGRQEGILTAAGDLERRRASLEERERDFALRERQAEQEPRPIEPPSRLPETSEPPQPSDAGDYHWKLDTLARLVDEGADSFPHRVDEWRYMLFYLRDEARIDGALPRRFDSLVEEAFGELLATA